LLNEELNSLYLSQNIIWVIKSRGLRWSGHVKRMRGIRNPHKILVGGLEGKAPFRITRHR